MTLLPALDGAHGDSTVTVDGASLRWSELATRADALGAYGQSSGTTPWIDRLAAGGAPWRLALYPGARGVGPKRRLAGVGSGLRLWSSGQPGPIVSFGSNGPGVFSLDAHLDQSRLKKPKTFSTTSDSVTMISARTTPIAEA